MTTTENVSYLHQVAPWPENRKEATPEVVARHFAAYAMQVRLRSKQLIRAAMESPGSAESDLYLELIEHSVALHAVASAMQLVARYAPEQAEYIAHRIWDVFEDGEGDERLWDWLVAEGIDPERLHPVPVSSGGGRP